MNYLKLNISCSLNSTKFYCFSFFFFILFSFSLNIADRNGIIHFKSRLLLATIYQHHFHHFQQGLMKTPRYLCSICHYTTSVFVHIKMYQKITKQKQNDLILIDLQLQYQIKKMCNLIHFFNHFQTHVNHLLQI